MLASLEHVFNVIKRANSHFNYYKGMQSASALSYSTLFAIIPITAVLFFFFLQIDLFVPVVDYVREQLLLQLSPGSRVRVEEYLLKTIQNISSVSYFTFAIIFFSAIWLSISIEKTLDQIWQVKVPHHLALRIPAHIILWLFAPVLMALSITASTWLISISYLHQFTDQVSLFSHLFPWLITSVTLFLLYYFVPNTYVNHKTASLSALFSGLLFEISKVLFSIYITEFAIYDKLYGALAALPIFMLWLFISWMIILWGASFCITLQSDNDTNDILR